MSQTIHFIPDAMDNLSSETMEWIAKNIDRPFGPKFSSTTKLHTRTAVHHLAMGEFSLFYPKN